MCITGIAGNVSAVRSHAFNMQVLWNRSLAKERFYEDGQSVGRAAAGRQVPSLGVGSGGAEGAAALAGLPSAQ